MIKISRLNRNYEVTNSELKNKEFNNRKYEVDVEIISDGQLSLEEFKNKYRPHIRTLSMAVILNKTLYSASCKINVNLGTIKYNYHHFISKYYENDSLELEEFDTYSSDNMNMEIKKDQIKQKAKEVKEIIKSRNLMYIKKYYADNKRKFILHNLDEINHVRINLLTMGRKVKKIEPIDFKRILQFYVIQTKLQKLFYDRVDALKQLSISFGVLKIMVRLSKYSKTFHTNHHTDTNLKCSCFRLRDKSNRGVVQKVMMLKKIGYKINDNNIYYIWENSNCLIHDEDMKIYNYQDIMKTSSYLDYKSNQRRQKWINRVKSKNTMLIKQVEINGVKEKTAIFVRKKKKKPGSLFKQKTIFNPIDEYYMEIDKIKDPDSDIGKAVIKIDNWLVENDVPRAKSKINWSVLTKFSYNLLQNIKRASKSKLIDLNYWINLLVHKAMGEFVFYRNVL